MHEKPIWWKCRHVWMANPDIPLWPSFVELGQSQSAQFPSFSRMTASGFHTHTYIPWVVEWYWATLSTGNRALFMLRHNTCPLLGCWWVLFAFYVPSFSWHSKRFPKWSPFLLGKDKHSQTKSLLCCHYLSDQEQPCQATGWAKHNNTWNVQLLQNCCRSAA